MYDSFKKYHPTVTFLYFTLVICFSMFARHPIMQIISCVSALIYVTETEGRKAVNFLFKLCLPMMLITAFINPAFSHEGVTILTYFPNGNPLTLESILYGFSAGLLIVTIMLWFMNFNRVITSDKFIYLFGRIIPSLSLVLSMTLRFIPKFKNQMTLVREAQESLGRDIADGNLIKRIKKAVTILSIMVTWSLENAIETADSMKSRGYGLKGRTAFSIYRFGSGDKEMLCFLFFCGIYLISGAAASVFSFRYFPSILSAPVNMVTLTFYEVYAALCIMPAVINYKEEKKWKALYSKM